MLKVASQDGTEIAYSVTGEGPAIILVDGAFCYHNNGPSAKLVPLLSKSFTVYAYDRRGRGESGNTLPYSVEREIDDLRAVSELAGESSCVVGMSSGGSLVLNALMQGLPFKKAALFEVPYVAASSPAAVPPLGALDELNNLVEANDRKGAVKYFMTKVFGAPPFFVAIMQYAMRSSWEKNESVAHTLPYDLQIMGDWNIPQNASTIKIPMLVLSGEKAPKKLRDAAESLARALPKSEHEILAKQSHNVSAAVLAPSLSEFFLK